MLLRCLNVLSPRLALFGIALGSLLMVVLAVLLGEALHLAACPLCIFQRVLYLAIFALALLAIPVSGRLRILLVAAAMLVALVGVGVAFWQSWLQIFPDPALECSYSDPNLVERLVDWLGMQWPRMFMATGFCSSKEWVLLGLSMANWSALTFVGLLGLLGLQLKRR